VVGSRVVQSDMNNQNKMFKANAHKARPINLKNIENMIERYNKKYATPKYMIFIKTMIEKGFKVSLYVARVSKYVYVAKDGVVTKIRFSNHKPIYEKEMENDCDYYVGISHKAVRTTEQIVKILTAGIPDEIKQLPLV